MIEFKDGDEVHGHYGSRWIRRDGRWFNKAFADSETLGSSDDTMQWLINLKIEYPKPTPKGPGKISKTQPIDAPIYQYQYLYRGMEKRK